MFSVTLLGKHGGQDNTSFRSAIHQSFMLFYWQLTPSFFMIHFLLDKLEAVQTVGR